MNKWTDQVVIWLDADIDPSNPSTQQTMEQLRQLGHEFHVFNSADPCVDLLTDLETQHVFLIVSEPFAQRLINDIHLVPSLYQIYITTKSSSPELKPWMESFSKIKGLYSNMQFLSQELPIALTLCNKDSIAYTFVPPLDGINRPNPDQLEPTFMYTQLFKDALLTMEYDEQSRRDFVAFCREKLTTCPKVQRLLEEFEREYSAEKAIWWYTRDSFIYSMLNQALRSLEADIILMMGFFIVDLHRQIEQLHRHQIHQYGSTPFTVYRGQRLSHVDFAKLRQNQGGLISFNSFLSTSRNKEVPLMYLPQTNRAMDIFGILLTITVDPTLKSVPFARIDHLSHFGGEDEILFSMHTVFRIGQVTALDTTSRRFEVSLNLTEEDDPQMQLLARSMRGGLPTAASRNCVANLLVSIDQTNMIERLYPAATSDSDDPETRIEAHYYRALANKHNAQNDIAHFHAMNAVTLAEGYFLPTDQRLAAMYALLALIFKGKGESSQALSFYLKALDIMKKSLPPDHPLLATSYNNIGSVYDSMGEYSQALSFYQQALDIMKKSLPHNHPLLATSYNNIGSVYDSMGEYSQALSFYQQALDIMKKSLPPDHPDLATSYNNIGLVYSRMGEFCQALSFYQQAMDIRKKRLRPNHPDLATSCSNIGGVYYKMGKYSQALSFYQQALDIMKKSLPPNHPSLATSYNNIGGVYYKMGLPSESLLSLQKAMSIFESSLPRTHPHIKSLAKSIETVKSSMETDRCETGFPVEE